MKKIVIFILVIVFSMAVGPAFTAEGGKKGASAQAYEHASDQAVFHRITDWFATVGKSEEEKTAIIAERKAKRAAIRAQKEAEKRTRKTEKEAQKTQKKVNKQIGQMKGKFRER